MRVAPVAKLAAEQVAQRKLDEERELSGPLQMRSYRLSYARAAEMAPIIKRFLSSRGEVIYDSRTNTLIVMDVR
jgi:type IV pilus assembly protein PilQ